MVGVIPTDVTSLIGRVCGAEDRRWRPRNPRTHWIPGLIRKTIFRSSTGSVGPSTIALIVSNPPHETMSGEQPNKPGLVPAQGPHDNTIVPPTEKSAETSNPTTNTTEPRGGIVKRAMGKAADGLNKSMSLGTNLKSQLSQSQPSLPVSAHRRIFSLSRTKGKEKATGEGERLEHTCVKWRSSSVYIRSLQMNKLRRSHKSWGLHPTLHY